MANIKARHLYQFGKAIATRRTPIYCQIAVTNGCAARCLYCAAPRRRQVESELDPAAYDKIAANLSRLGVVFVVLTGGEPLLRPDLERIVTAFASRGMITRIQTTGIEATPERVRSLIDAGLDDFSISMDSLSPAIQGELTGVADVSDRIMTAIAATLAYRRPTSMLTGINAVATRRTLDGLPNLVAFCSHVGLIVSVIPYHSGGGSQEFVLRTDPEGGLGFQSADAAGVRSVFETLVRMKRLGHLIHDSSWLLRQAPDFLLGSPPPWRCESPDLYFTIEATGRIQPCVDRRVESAEFNATDDGFVDDFVSGRIRDAFAEVVRSCEGCLYPCYPEFHRLVRYPSQMWERMLQVSHSSGSRPARSAAELSELARRFAEMPTERLVDRPSRIDPR